ncbi:hypothetical protein P9112_002892 [Eukaryota sp. TZLM1-RC]
MPEYGTVNYWEERYKKEPNTNFDWYITYTSFKSVINSLLDENHRILVVGCGNSRLSQQLHDDGFKHVTSIDISQWVIDQMQEKYRETCPDLEWQVMDVKRLDFPSESFDVVIDKGTIDAILCGKDSFDNAHAAHKEIQRVLQPNGTYINITYGTPEARLDHFKQPGLNWNIEFKTIPKSHVGTDADAEDHSNYFYVYILSGKSSSNGTEDSTNIE